MSPQADCDGDAEGDDEGDDDGDDNGDDDDAFAINDDHDYDGDYKCDGIDYMKSHLSCFWFCLSI